MANMNERIADLTMYYERNERRAALLNKEGNAERADRLLAENAGIRHALWILGYELSTHYLSYEDFDDGNGITIITRAN